VDRTPASTIPGRLRAPEAGPPHGAPADEGMPRRVRWSMYLAFAALALLALAQSWFAHHDSRARIVGHTAANEVGHATETAQRIAHLATLLDRPDGVERSLEPLRMDLLRLASQRSRIDAALAAKVALDPAGAGTLDASARAVIGAMDAPLDIGRALLERIDGGSAFEDWAGSRVALVREARGAAGALDRLAEQLDERFAERTRAAQRTTMLSALLVLLVLLALALGVVEPTVHAVRRQFGLLARQQEELRRLALVAECTHNVVLVVDRERRVAWANEAFTRTTGWTLAEVQGRSSGELRRAPGTDAEALARLQRAIEDGRGAREEVLFRTRSGLDYWADVDVQPLHDERGELGGAVIVETDVTMRVNERQRMQSLLRALPAGVVVIDAAGRIVQLNPAAEALLATPAGEAVGLTPLDPHWQVLREDGEPLPNADLPAMRTLATGQGLRGQTIGVRLPGGELRWLLVNTEPIPASPGGPHGVVACFVDATEQRRLQDELRRGARTDLLTGLPNRHVVHERIGRALAHARAHPGYGFAVLFMDFDRFKQVNDTLGHGVGDALLRAIAERLAGALRPGDAVARVGSAVPLAARIGGDEFVVVLEGMRSAADAGAVADRLLAAFALPFQVGPHVVHSGVSIGVVASEQAAGDADAVLRDADTAMYEAKRAGRGRWVRFDPSMHERLARTVQAENDLRRALAEEELHVVYQPVVALGAGGEAAASPLAVEALVRWQHPTRGAVPPSEFIPLAEEVGMIDAIGAFVLRSACRQFVRWQAELGAAAPSMVAVNLSRAQLKNPLLVAEVEAVLAESGFPPSALQLEVTESLAAQDDAMQQTLRALKALGVRLALDDFGTGYSSLACLHQLPIDTVKIDRSFVSHAKDVEYHRVLIEATIRVARTLGLRTVAEGIETPGQAALMAQLGCDRGQGYLFARPLPGEALARWARERTGVAEPA
jgi:diguanylate cyclase (GGDEF)-like protein/PAS domain S-box-containing protein